MGRWSRLVNALRGDRLIKEIDEELASHLVGRVFTAANETEPVAVISQRFWDRRFGASRDVLGRVLTVDRVTFSIVGVAPPGFCGCPSCSGGFPAFPAYCPRLSPSVERSMR